MESPAFVAVPVWNQKVILQQMTTTNPLEDVTFESTVFDALSLKILSMEALTPVPTAPRLLRPQQSATREK